MASQKLTPKQKKPPARQRATRESVQRMPIREVIHHPSERIPIHSVGAASKLKGTIKGASTKGKGNDTTPLKPLPARFNVKPDGSVMTPKEVYDTYAASGQYDISQAQINSYTNLYNQAVEARQAQTPVGTVVAAVGNIITDIPGIVAGDPSIIADANAQATAAMNVIRGDHTVSQTSVGGTKGSATIVDRSAANKKAWLTRKKLYGSSGQKEK